MPELATTADLERWQRTLEQQASSAPTRICVCGGRTCSTLGGNGIAETFTRELDRQGLSNRATVVVTGCPGFCEPGPIVTIRPAGIVYTRVAPDDAEEIVQATIGEDRIVERLLYRDPVSGRAYARESELPFYAAQQRILLKDCGVVDPGKIEDYVARGGYLGLARALAMAPTDVVGEVTRSGLRGRGGAGFPAGVKWETCRRAAGDQKYVICNADEANPGAFQDRSIVAANPHAVVEGMLIGAYAIGASQGYVYVRHDHAPTIAIIEQAIAQARAHGLLGRRILGAAFDFDLHVHQSAGAFVCGEETALIASLEGRMSEPVSRPPFPAERGLWGKPTNINNAKSWATVPHIMRNGAEWYAAIGTAKSKGTTVFSLNGKIRTAGLVEVPMGVTLRHIIETIGGGMRDGHRFKAAQPGGPSGGCIPESLLDLPVDYENLAAAGSMMGSGGLIVMDDRTCMVDVARYFTAFNQAESCGKCTACREGVRQMLTLLDGIVEGRGQEGDVELIEQMAMVIKDGSLCGLGKAAPNPVLTTIKYFRHEYDAHIREGRCPAGVCRMPVTA